MSSFHPSRRMALAGAGGALLAGGARCRVVLAHHQSGHAHGGDRRRIADGRGGDAQLLGADGEMISLIAAKLDLTMQPALMEWSATVQSVRSGRADVMLRNMA